MLNTSLHAEKQKKNQQKKCLTKIPVTLYVKFLYKSVK